MKSVILRATLILIFTIILCGCSGAGDSSNPVIPDDVGAIPDTTLINNATSSSSNHIPLGFSVIEIDASDPDDVKAEMVPMRAGSILLNILKLLEFGPCFDCFKIVGINVIEPGTLDVDIMITHPFGNLDFSIFDVHGIIMFDGWFEFPALERWISDPALGDGLLVNAEGFTSLYNAWTFEWAGELFTYIPGKLSTLTFPDADCNGFLRHNTDNPANTRNAFYAGDSVTRTYRLKMPTTVFTLGYAVDANWALPISSPVTDPITGFGLDANSPEPWKIEISAAPIGESGSTDVTIDVYDWQGTATINPPIIESPELFSGIVKASYVMEGAGFSRWVAPVQNKKSAGIGEYKCLVWVEAIENDPVNSPWLDQSAYQVGWIGVSVSGPSGDGWARTWGGASIDYGAGVAIDSAGDIYVAGYFDYYIEFDFPEGNDIYFLDPETPDQSYLVKFNSSGAYEWSRTWGGSSDSDRAYAVAADGSGHIFVAGRFEGNADFDPGDGVDLRSCENGWWDVYVSMFDTSGNYNWVQTWGGSGDDEGFGVAADSFGNVFVAGIFEGSADFDPGGGYDGHSSNGDDDAFLSMLDVSGNWLWTRTWGGPSIETCPSVTLDGSGGVYATGYFLDTVDFDPGGGVDLHFANGSSSDVYLIKLDSYGGYVWAKTWGGTGGDTGRGVGTDGSGYIFVTGLYNDTTDFDPGAGSDNHTSNGDNDAYLSKFSTSGTFLWARTWGGSGMDYGNSVDGDSSGNVIVTGMFRHTVDFDPGGGIDSHSSNYYDAFLSKFSSSGTHQWALTYGGDTWDEGDGVAIDTAGNISCTGYYQGTADFDGGSGTDWHTAVQSEDAFLIRQKPDGTW